MMHHHPANRQKHHGGMGVLFPVLAALLVAVALLGMYVMIQQRMSDTRRRMQSMRAEMGAISTSLLSLRSQQDAMLTRESLRQHLASAGAQLEPISTQAIIHLPESGAPEKGVAMEAPRAAAPVR